MAMKEKDFHALKVDTLQKQPALGRLFLYARIRVIMNNDDYLLWESIQSRFSSLSKNGTQLK